MHALMNIRVLTTVLMLSFPLRWRTVLMVCSDSRVPTALKTTTLFSHSGSVNYDQILKVTMWLGRGARCMGLYCKLKYKIWGNHSFKFLVDNLQECSPFTPYLIWYILDRAFGNIRGQWFWEWGWKKKIEAGKKATSPPPQSSQGLQSSETFYQSMFHNLLTGGKPTAINRQTNPINLQQNLKPIFLLMVKLDYQMHTYWVCIS